MNNKTRLLLGVFALVCFAGGIGLYFAMYKPQSTATSTDVKKTGVVGQTRPAFTMRDTNDKVRDIKEWDGQVIMLNFWATWCPPCRREIPAFIDLYDKYRDKGFIIVGMALDTKEAAVDFVDPMGINYPILVGEQEGITLTQQYGNDLGILPFTIIIDRKGIIRHAIRHELTFEQVEQLITPLL